LVKELEMRTEGRGWCTSMAVSAAIYTPRSEARPYLETTGRGIETEGGGTLKKRAANNDWQKPKKGPKASLGWEVRCKSRENEFTRKTKAVTW
jgi:hypothetical protein